MPNVVDGVDEDVNGDSNPREVASMEKRKEVYARHCLPDIPQIVKRVKEVALDYAALVDEKQMLEAQSKLKSQNSWRWWIPSAIAEALEYNRPENGTDTDFESIRTTAFGDSENSQPPAVAAASRYLKKIYILTNGEPIWLDEVKDALRQDAKDGWAGLAWEWEDIAISRDLRLGWEEKPVSQALDMYVAQRAEVFIGNGVSCF